MSDEVIAALEATIVRLREQVQAIAVKQTAHDADIRDLKEKVSTDKGAILCILDELDRMDPLIAKLKGTP